MSWEIVAALLCLGACTGFLAGLLGIGGGMVLTPFMTMLLVYVPACPIQLLFILPSRRLWPPSCSRRFLRCGRITKRGAVLWNVVASSGSRYLGRCPPRGQNFQPSADLLDFSRLRLFCRLFRRQDVHQLQAGQPKRTLPGMAGMFGAGTGIGVVSALVGAGGGFISVPFMVWCNVKMHNAVGTSAALGFPIAAAGTLGYIITGWGEPGLTAVSHDAGLHSSACLVVRRGGKHLHRPVRRQGRPQHRHETA